MSVIQFFEFFGDALTAASVEAVSIPEIAQLCVLLSASNVSDADLVLLDSVGRSLCAVLQIQIEGNQHWSETIVKEYGNNLCSSSKNNEFDRHSIASELQSFVKTAYIKNNGESKSWVGFNPEFRIEMISYLLQAAVECDNLRSIYDNWTEKTEVVQAKGNDI